MTKFVDANIIIRAFTENEDKERCRQVVNEPFVTNTLCLVEAEHSISKIRGNRVYACQCIKSMFKSNCTIINLDRNLLFESFKRIEKYNLNIFYLINYVTALLNNCHEFISYDKDFDNLEIKRTEP